MIAIATHVNGRGIRHISRFKNRLDFLTYADQATESAGFFISRRATISDICDALADRGPGLGSRFHRRISKREIYQEQRARILFLYSAGELIVSYPDSACCDSWRREKVFSLPRHAYRHARTFAKETAQRLAAEIAA